MVRSAPILYDVSRPINGDKAKVWGLELGVQHFFSNGFGVRANYTLTDTKAYVDGVHVGDLEGVSESAYSLALMFENDRWDAQVAADYSGEYLETADAVAGLLREAADAISLGTHVSVQYKFTDSLTVSVEGLQSPRRSFTPRISGDPTCSQASETWGRSYLVGVTAKCLILPRRTTLRLLAHAPKEYVVVANATVRSLMSTIGFRVHGAHRGFAAMFDRGPVETAARIGAPRHLRTLEHERTGNFAFLHDIQSCPVEHRLERTPGSDSAPGRGGTAPGHDGGNSGASSGIRSRGTRNAQAAPRP